MRYLIVAALLALGCGSATEDPYADQRTERLVFRAQDGLVEHAIQSAEEWSAMTGLGVSVDNDAPGAIRISWVERESMRRNEETGAYARGDATIYSDPVDGSFIRCAIRVGRGQTDDEVALTVRHEMGHCLAGLDEHTADDGCLMHPRGLLTWCDSDVRFVCDELGC